MIGQQARALQRLKAGNGMPEPAARRTARLVAVASGKGGVGKTTLSVNLALAVQELGRRTVLLDADLGLANVDILLGGMVPEYHLGHVLQGVCSLEQALVPGPLGVQVVAGSSGLAELAGADPIALQGMLVRLEALDRLADVLLVDTGAGIGPQVLALLHGAREVVVVTTPEPTAITDAYSLVKVLSQTSAPQLHLVVNMCRSAGEGERALQRLQVVAWRFLGVALNGLGTIPFDPAASHAVMEQRPLLLGHPRSPAAHAVRQVARALLQLEAPGGSRGGLVATLRRMMRRHP